MIESRFAMMHSKSDIVGEWHEHICSLGMHLIRCEDDDGRIYFEDPATLMESAWGKIDRAYYIVVPEDLALKILALGCVL